MDLSTLKPGDRVRTIDGATVLVINETQDGQWIKVQYLESPDEPALVGTEDLCHEDELSQVIESGAPTG